jgi:hypothetical protein
VSRFFQLRSFEKARVLRREFPKRCTKCFHLYTFKQWHRLPYVGLMEDEECGEVLELRNCPCGTTLAIELVEARE